MDTARDGFEALERARSERPDVVVADLHMPCLGGDALCARMKQDEDLADTPVVLMVPGDVAEERAQAVHAGADDIVAKPINRMSLIQAVSRFLRAGSLRGQARVPLSLPVKIRHEDDASWGTARNLSRGGMFVESEIRAEPGSELALAFELPEVEEPLASTAQVIWRREPGASAAGMGLRFLALDRGAAEEIDTYVYERAAPLPELAPPTAGANG